MGTLEGNAQEHKVAMDAIKAAMLEEKLRGCLIDGWKIESLINHGKSAAVFLASDGDAPVAIKVFDDELIERYGDKTQLARIDRELSLVGKNHPNMVKVFGGGVDANTNNHYLIMEYLPGDNLKQCLQDIPVENISMLITQLASAAEYLESESLVHRDIKPENIVILDDYRKLVLLDFGVLRPVGVAGLTDGDGILSFVGTLQYSSPEFLLRKEDDTQEGWRALTFYQLGGVLHDLIMRRSLFEDFAAPYARLVNAVQFEQPEIQNSAVAAHLVELARSCLLKDPKVRTKLVRWSDFARSAASEASSGESAKQRVTNRTAMVRAQQAETSGIGPEQPTIEAPEVRDNTMDFIKTAIRSIRNDNSIFPPIRVSREAVAGDCLKIKFLASSVHRLQWGLTILTGVTVLDSAARVIAISARVHVGEGPDPQTAPDWYLVFQGIYNGAAIYAAFEDFVYTAIDKAQQLRASGDRENGYGPWLSFEDSEKS